MRPGVLNTRRTTCPHAYLYIFQNFDIKKIDQPFSQVTTKSY
jgi:hypothetical protein